METIEKIYEGVDSRLEYHNKDYNAMKWKDFMKLKLDAFYLLEASQSEAAAKSALSDLNWFPDLADIYSGQQTMAAMDVALKAQGQQKLSYPIQGKNIK